MRQLSQTRTAAGESVSRTLRVDRLTDTQREKLKRTVGNGLWEEILEGQDLSESTIGLIKRKMRRHRMLPVRMWWQEA